MRGSVAPVLTALIASLAMAGAASAQVPRVVLSGDDATLADAVEVALAAWNAELVVAPGPTPGDSMPGSAERGRAVAAANDATAVVWISIDGTGAAALWVYDRASDRVLARALPVAPPFDEVTAAAVALSVKTLLRHSGVAPAWERLAAPGRPSDTRLELAVGVQALGTAPADAEARVGAAWSWWPRELDSAFGLGIVLRGGSGTSVAGDLLAGRLWSGGLHLRVAGRWALERLLDVGVGAELGATLWVLDASVQPGGRPADPVDLDPTALAWLELGLRPWPSLRVAIRAGLFASSRTRSYLVRGASALETLPVAAVAELGVEIPLDGGVVDSP